MKMEIMKRVGINILNLILVIIFIATAIYFLRAENTGFVNDGLNLPGDAMIEGAIEHHSPVTIRDGLMSIRASDDAEEFHLFVSGEDTNTLGLSSAFDNTMVFGLNDTVSNANGMSMVFIDGLTSRPTLTLNQGAVGRFNFFERSLVVGDGNGAKALDANYTLSSSYPNLSFDTSTYGADLGIEHDAQILGSLFVDTINESTTSAGVTIDSDLEITGDIISRGIKWTSRPSAVNNSWNSVAYGNGLFVALSNTGTGNRVMTSPDGANWTARTSAADNSWIDVVYGNGLFVAVSFDGIGNRVMTSPDGINWSSKASAVDNNWQSITYGNGLFVAVANSGTGDRVITSSNGEDWVSRSSAVDNNWMSVTYGDGLFVAVAITGTGNRVMTSPDGANWIARTSAADNYWQEVTYGNGLFVAVAWSGTGDRVMTSPDGVNWSYQSSAADNTWMSVTYGDGLFVAVADSGTGDRVMTSTDGTEWVSRTSATNNDWYGVTYGNGVFVAVADTGTGNRAMTSGRPYINEIPTDNIYQGGMSVFGKVSFGTANPSPLSPFTVESDYNEVALFESTDEITIVGIQQDIASSYSTLRLGTDNADNSGYLINYGSTHPAQPSELSLKSNYGDLTFYTGLAGFGTETVRIDTSGNVGIGTGITPPTEKLTVAGDLRLYGTSGTLSHFLGTYDGTGGTQGAELKYTFDSGLELSAIKRGTHFEDITFQGNDLVFETGVGTVSEAMRITDAGNVDVVGNITVTGTVDGIDIATDVAANTTHRSSDGSNHTHINQSVTTDSNPTFSNLTIDNDLEVAGEIISTGTVWESQTSAASNLWYDVAYGNGLFAAIASSGTSNRIMTSPDGVNWKTRVTPNNSWKSITYGNGLFVAIAYSGTGDRVMTSSNGVDWESQSTPSDLSWVSVTYGNGLFVAVADSGTNDRVMTSVNGVDWVLGTSSSSNDFTSVTYGNGLFVAVSWLGTSSRVMTSSDGFVWVNQTPAVVLAWKTVTYGNGLFVAVAQSGTGNRIMTSPDGATWTSRTSSDYNWTDIVYGEGLFVVISDSDKIMTSSDGITFITRTIPNNNAWEAVTCGNGMFVAVSRSGTDRVMTSGKATTNIVSHDNIYQGGMSVFGRVGLGTAAPDAEAILELNSTTKGFLPPRMPATQRDAIETPPEGLQVHDTTNNKPDYFDGTVWKAFVSTDISTFAVGSVPFATGAHHISDDNANLFWDNTLKRLGIGTNNPSESLEVVGDIVSKGTSWTSQIPAATNNWRDVTWGNGLFVAVAGTGTGDRVMTSPDGINWTSRTSAADNQWYGIAYSNGIFVAVADTGIGDRVMTSPDGITWTSRTSAADNDWKDIAYGNGVFVAVADDGISTSVMTSPDGSNWTIRTAASSNEWNAVVYGDGLFVAVAGTGTGDRVMTSPDGITWTSRTSAADNLWYALTYGNGLFIATSFNGTGNRIMTSPDGITWTIRTSPADYEWLDVTYGAGLFVSVANSGGTIDHAMTSPDGITWTLRTTPDNYGYRGIVYGNGMFVAVASGPGQGVMTSGKSEFNETSVDNIYQGGMSVFGRVGLGTAEPHADAILELSSTTKGFLPPRMPATQRDAIETPPEGLQVHDTTNNKPDYFDGTVWKAFVSTDISTFAVGSIPFATGAHHISDDNANLFWDNTNKRLGIGINPPTETLHVDGQARVDRIVFDRGGSQDSYVERGSAGVAKGMSFYTIDTERLSILEGGNVGIGINNPAEKLDISGNIAVSGTVDGRDLATDGTKLDGIATGAEPSTKEFFISPGTGTISNNASFGANHIIFPNAVTFVRCHFTFRLPSDFLNMAAGYPKVVFKQGDGGTGDYRLAFNTKAGGAGEQLAANIDDIAEYTRVSPGTSNVIFEEDVSAAVDGLNLAAGDYINIQIDRDSDDTLDTFGGDLDVMGVLIKY